MLEEMKSYILKNKLFPKDARLLLAVSGGPDSMAMAHLLMCLRKEWPLHLEIFHLNHCLRPEAKEEMEMVIQWGQHWKIPCHCREVDINQYAKAHQLGIEAAGREVRQKYFKDLLLSLDGDAVVTAHHSDDRVETILLNLIRGSGISGLSAMRPIDSNCRRPMLFTTKSRILDYLEAHHIPYAIDQTNEGDDYLRNHIRHHLIPLLNSYNPQASNHIAETASNLEEIDFALKIIIREKAEKVIKKWDQSRVAIAREDLQAEPVALAKGICLEAIKILNPSIQSLSRAKQNQLQNILKMNHIDKRLDLGHDIKVYIEEKYLMFQLNTLQEGEIRYDITWDFKKTGHLNLSDWPGQIVVKREKEVEDSLWIYRGIPDEKLTIRHRQPGDVIKLKGIGHKRLKKIFQEAKVPVRLRETWPVLCDNNNHIIWLPGLAKTSRMQQSDELSNYPEDYLECVPELSVLLSLSNGYEQEELNE